MGDIQAVLRSAVKKIFSDSDYEQSFTFYCLWFDIAQTYFLVPSDQIFDAIWSERARGCFESYTTIRQTTSTPSTGTPSTGTPSTGTPSTGIPSTGTPSTGIPSTGTPSTGTPSTGVPSNWFTSTGNPSTGFPSTRFPSTGTTGIPSTGIPSTGTPSTGNPSTGFPSTRFPSTGNPSTGTPTTPTPVPGWHSSPPPPPPSLPLDPIHPNAHLILRIASDAESDHILGPHNSGLQSRLCAKILPEFFEGNLWAVYNKTGFQAEHAQHRTLQLFYAHTNLIARWANLGYVQEAAIHSHILQSLISHQKLHNHQADALIILFKLAGATFEAHVDPSVIDRCFELLKGNYSRDSERGKLVQEVVALRESGWEGLPPPPVFTTGKPKPTGADQKDPAATPIAKSLGLPNRDLEPQIPQPSPLESATVQEPNTVPASPVAQSPSISIATLSDFTIADTSDEESPIDPAATVQHETFYLEDGNIEVLCGNTLFRVHMGVLSFHSPTLRRMFAQTNLATAESPNGCPRISSSDTATDFATLLKTIYIPGFPERNKVPDFATFSSLLRITAKYEMPTVRSQLLEVVRDAYPENFEGLAPSKPLGENVFSGPTPHPNAVLKIFVQQKLVSALPMAYYMAVRRGPDSLMDRRLPRNAVLPLEVLQPAIRGFVALREVELNETHRLVFGPKGSRPCSTSKCPSHAPTGPAALEAYQKVFDHIVGHSQSGTKVLQVPEFYEDCGGEPQCVGPGICGRCVERWESGHADLRKKAWATLSDIFGLKG